MGWCETPAIAVPPMTARPAAQAAEPQFAPDTPLEAAPDLPRSYAPQIDAITLFPDPGEWPPASFNDQRFGYVLHGSAGASYESNVFIQPTNAQEDFIFRIAPAIALGWGDFKAEVPRPS